MEHQRRESISGIANVTMADGSLALVRLNLDEKNKWQVGMTAENDRNPSRRSIKFKIA